MLRSTMTDNRARRFLSWLARAGRLLLIVWLATCGPLAYAQENNAAPPEVDVAAETEVATAPVEIDGELLFRVRGVTSFPAKERAAAIQKRIEQLAADPKFKAEDVKVVEAG